MSQVRKTQVKIGGKNGVIFHDKLIADGPIDEKTGEPLINPKTGQPYPGANDDMADLLHVYQEFLRGNAANNDSPSGHSPRFGVLTLSAHNTPIFAYDHPAFKKIANTAFTDGMHVFIDADFMRKLVDQELASGERQSGVIFVLLHELMHKIYGHVGRLKAFPPDIANIAEDMVINGKLVKGFKLDPVPLLQEIGQGMKQEEANKYSKMAEEVVAEMLLINQRKKKKKEQEQNQSGQPQKGQGGQGQGQGGDPDDSENDSQGDEQENDSQQNKSGGQKKGSSKGDKQDKNKGGSEPGEDGDENGEGQEYSPIHHITPEELLEILKEEGLEDTVGKALDLPKAGDVEGLGKKKERAQLSDVDAIQTAIADAQKCNGKYPGQHIAEEAAELITGLQRGKVQWKLGIRKHFLGDGLRLRETDDEAAIPWYLDKSTTGVDPFYMGSLVPQAPDETVLCLVDTSGSTSGGGMRQAFLSEALGLKKGVSSMGDTARKVILMSADTVIRGEPIEINEYNVESFKNEGVPIFGNGGTDFARCLHEALSSPKMKKEKIKSVVYFTDCCDNPPKRADFAEYLDKGIKIVFVTVPSMWSEQWNRDVSPFAEVYCIEEGTQINLDNESKKNDPNTRKNRL